MSANAPILQLILEKLTELNTRVSKIEGTVGEIQKQLKNESDIQERAFTNQLKTDLDERYKLAKITTVLFGKFYTPTSNKEFTDIDGCVLTKSPPQVFQKNGKLIKIDQSCIYIIEAKHAITKPILDNKLKQFLTIMNVIDTVKTTNYSPKNPKSMFDRMVLKHDILNFPDNICFLMSTEKISPDALQMLIHIASGKLTNEIYNELLFEYVYNHPLILDVINDTDVDKYVSTSLKGMKTLDDFVLLLNPIEPAINAKQSQKDFYNKKSTILKYKERLENLVTPYADYIEFLEPLKGRLGFISKTEIQLPEDLIREGFNSKNSLLTASQTNYIKSVGV